MAVKTASKRPSNIAAAKLTGGKTSRTEVKAAKPKTVVKSKYPGMLGMTHFTREAKEHLERSSRKKLDVLFSTSTRVPQIRFRPASEHEDEVDDMAENKIITVTDLNQDSMAFRSLVMVGIDFLVVSGKDKVIMDRHPAFKATVVNFHMKDYRAQARTENQRKTREHAYKARTGVRRVEEILERFEESLDARDADMARRLLGITNIMEEVLLAAPPEKQAKLRDYRKELDAIVNKDRLLREKHLERNEVGTN
jgi:hypothetical protein